MALNQQELQAHLAAESNFFVVHLFETVPSTNQTLWELIAAGAKPGTVVIATNQTSGRGQWGRQWVSPSGGLYLSLAIAPNIPAQQSFQLTLCSAWGIAQALRDRGIPVELKWCNDLILCQRKLGGILTETKVQQGLITKAVVGVGINWANPVPETGINLKNYGHAITSLEMLAAVTLSGIASAYQLYLQTGIETLLQSYQQILTNIGQAVCIDGTSGIIVGVTPTGELRVRLETTDSIQANTQSEIYLQPGTISLGYDQKSRN